MLNTFAVSILDGEGEDDRRTARMLATITALINNSLRLSGTHVPDGRYRTEEEFMPQSKRHRPAPQPKTWSGAVRSLGF